MGEREITRRQLLGGAAGLQLGIYLSTRELGLFRLLTGAESGLPRTALAQSEEGFAFGAFVAIAPDGEVTVTIQKPDIGQGTRTSFAMLIAEDLEADWERLRVVQAPAGADYGNQGVGGSYSIRGSWRAMRTAGATARLMLVAAAAEAWGVDADACLAEQGVVRHPASGRELGYGELAAAAARQPVPGDAPLKPWRDCRLIGQPKDRVDNLDVVTGRAGYGVDTRLPGMLYAVIARPPVLGARLLGQDDREALALPGVRAVLPGVAGGVAVVAEHTWAALQARDRLDVQWDMGANVALSGKGIRQRLAEAAAELPPLPASVATPVEIELELPYLAHAMMEPHNCTAHVHEDGCEVWAPTQNPQSVQRTVASALGIASESVIVHTTLAGGGFGRRADTAAAREAALVSRAVGAPVQLLWCRRDDLQQAAYRPASHHHLRGGLDAAGRPVAWAHRMGMSGRGAALLAAEEEPELARLEGLNAPDQGEVYDIPGYGVDKVTVGTPVPTTFWRSVDHSQTIFANELFVDMLAVAAGADPYLFRREHLTDGRLRAVLERVADMSGWGEPRRETEPGRALGIACFAGYGSCIAHVVDLTVASSGRVRVHRIWAAVDPGLAINPRGVIAQVEGAAIDGLATAFRAALTVEGGAIQETSYYDYEWLRIDEAPPIEIEILEGGSTPGGMGEVGYPSVCPAVANAIFAATGRRITRLPIRTADLAGWAEPGPPVPPPVVEPTPIPPPPDRGGETIFLPDLRRGR